MRPTQIVLLALLVVSPTFGAAEAQDKSRTNQLTQGKGSKVDKPTFGERFMVGLKSTRSNRTRRVKQP